MYVSCVVFKGELIVNYESKVFEAVYCLYGFVVIDDGVVGLWRDIKKHFFCFTDIEFELFFSAPLSEVGDCVVVFLG